MEVSQATAGHPGHKNMIWVGRGFPPIDWVNADAQTQDKIHSLMAMCTNMLRDSRVTLYSVDPVGLSSEPPPQDEDGFEIGDPFGGNVDFDQIARETGGQGFHGRNDVDNLIGNGVRDGETFYTLSYTPSAVSEDAKAFRKIHVVMKDRSLTAVTREGYYPGTPAVAPALSASGKPTDQLVFDMGVAGGSLMVYDGVRFTIRRDATAADKFHLRVRAADLTWTPEGARQSTKVALEELSFDRKDKLVNRKVNELKLSLPVLADGAAETRTLDLVETISTAAPAARVRFVVRSDANGRVGAGNFLLGK